MNQWSGPNAAVSYIVNLMQRFTHFNGCFERPFPHYPLLSLVLVLCSKRPAELLRR